MNPLFSRISLVLLESLSFTKTLYAFDFDGTLSKIVRKPSEARITATTDSLLKKLSQTVPLAIVSGRSVSDLKTRLSFEPRFLIGNHGLEGLDKGHHALKQAEKICSGWRRAFAEKELNPGIEIEDKLYSFALHYRRSRNKKASRQEIQSLVDSLSPSPHLISGKSVVNLLVGHKNSVGASRREEVLASAVLYQETVRD